MFMPLIPVIYLWIHYKLLAQKQNVMSAKCIVEIIRRTVRLPPKQLDRQILIELEKYNLIEKINKKSGYRINQDKLLVLEPFF